MVRNRHNPNEIGKIVMALPPLMGQPTYLIEYKDKDKIRMVIVSKRSCVLVHRKSEPVPYKNVIITISENKVIAKDVKTGKTGIARCNPADKFDFATGAKIAIERLTGSPEVSVPGYEKKPPMLNCKFILCNNFARMTKGKIYEVKDGRYLDDAGRSFPMYGDGLHTFEELEAFIKAPVIEVNG